MTARTRLTTVLAAIGTALVIRIPTDVVPNPWFGREIGAGRSTWSCSSPSAC